MPRGTHVGQAADSVALRDVWALTTIDSEAQRRRTAGGVPLPPVSARTRARKCSTTVVCNRCFLLQGGNASALSTFSLPGDGFQLCCFCARLSNILTTRPHFFSAPKYASHGLFFAVNCLILPLPMLLAHLQPCSLLASASHKCLITAPDCAAQRASNAPSSAG